MNFGIQFQTRTNTERPFPALISTSLGMSWARTDIFIIQRRTRMAWDLAAMGTFSKAKSTRLSTLLTRKVTGRCPHRIWSQSTQSPEVKGDDVLWLKSKSRVLMKLLLQESVLHSSVQWRRRYESKHQIFLPRRLWRERRNHRRAIHWPSRLCRASSDGHTNNWTSSNYYAEDHSHDASELSCSEMLLYLHIRLIELILKIKLKEPMISFLRITHQWLRLSIRFL